MAATLHHIASLVLNRPLMLLPSKLETIAAVLGGRIGIDASGLTPSASRFVGSHVDQDPSGARGVLPYRRTAEGTAIIPVIGSTVNRGAWIGASSGLVSYEGLKFQLATAAEDPRTRAVLLDMECPGGEAIGCFETAAIVRQVAARKPVVAVVNGMAASAAYAIASAATRIVTTPTGISGSIGVVMLHADYSGALAKAGVKPTFVFAGAHKVDANPYQALPAAVRDRLQAEIETFYDAFVETVATGRKNLSAEAIRATEAQTYMGVAAVAAGLADEVGTFEGALADLVGGRITTSTPQGIPTVTNEKRQPGATSAQASADLWAEVIAEENARLGLRRRPTAVPSAGGAGPQPAPTAAQAGFSWDQVVAEVNRDAGVAR